MNKKYPKDVPGWCKFKGIPQRGNLVVVLSLRIKTHQPGTAGISEDTSTSRCTFCLKVWDRSSITGN